MWYWQRNLGGPSQRKSYSCMWRALINKSNLYFEANRITKGKQKRDDHKEWQLNPARQNSWHEFLTCDVRAPMGLNSQMRVLNKWCTQPVFIGYDGQNKKNPSLRRLVAYLVSNILFPTWGAKCNFELTPSVLWWVLTCIHLKILIHVFCKDLLSILPLGFPTTTYSELESAH